MSQRNLLHHIHRWRLCLLLGMALVVIAANQPAAAAPAAQTLPATLTLTPASDAAVDQLQDDTNFGAAENLVVAFDGAPSTFKHTLLRFDLSTLPVNAVVTRAELRLFQTQASNASANNPFNLDFDLLDRAWDEATVTWNDQPGSSATNLSQVGSSTTTNEYIAFNVASLLIEWRLRGEQNFGFMMLPSPDNGGRRTYASRETTNPPQLVIEYTTVTVPDQTNVPKVDGICSTETNGDYAGVTPYTYQDAGDAPGNIYIKQAAGDLYICVQGTLGSFDAGRDFVVTVDTNLTNNGDGNMTPDADDFAFRVTLPGGVATARQGTGTPNSPYAPYGFEDWEVQIALDADDETETAEYRIGLAELTDLLPICNAPFAIGVYHRAVITPSDAYGWPTGVDADIPTGPDAPASWMHTRLQNPQCPIQVCTAIINSPEGLACTVAGNDALVYRTADGAKFSTDANGLVVNRAAISFGAQLWALDPFAGTPFPEEEGAQEGFTVYATNGTPATVTPAAFSNGPIPGMMTLVVSETEPLLLHELRIASQWPLNDEQQTVLAEQVRQTSDFLYDFTDGQLALGVISVTQSYEGWDDADLWLYTNNNMRPKATAGGVIEEKMADPGGSEIVYYPGFIHMGRYWNRFQRPEGEPIVFDGAPIDPSTLTDDWAIVMAHEMGHYMLFLFDTYFGISPRETVVDVDSCTGSAMGWVYEPENWGYVFDEAHWAANCAATHAQQLLGQDEWSIIGLHYPWLQRPTGFVAGPTQPPVSLTKVSFVAPAGGGTPLVNQLFDLLYENDETASRKAWAYLMRGELVLSQGNPPRGGTQIELAGAEVGDRFCVYDIDAAPPAPNTPRHQYGCEILEEGDNELDLERDTSWEPIVLINPVGPTSIAISVTQPVTGATVVARVFAEHEARSFTETLTSDGNVHSATFELGESTPAAFVQVYVDENASENDPRREAMAMYGVDGGTVPGPSRWNEKGPVYSPDGESQAWPLEAITLEEGQWVSIQYMVETFPTPSGETRLTDAYRIISWPPDLAERVIVSIRAPLGTGEAAIANAPSAVAADAPTLTVRYWNGSQWQATSTNVTLGQDGSYLASAIVPGDLIYALFEGDIEQHMPSVLAD